MLFYSSLSYVTNGSEFLLALKIAPVKRAEEGNWYPILRTTKMHAVLSGDDLQS